jgi:hypothetical protein
MKSIPELLDMKCGDMLAEIGRSLGRDLSLGEGLELAALSGAYKAGGAGVSYSDLVHPPAEVKFPDYLRALGYPLDKDGRESRARQAHEPVMSR